MAGLGGAPSLAPGNPGSAAPVQNSLAALITALGALPQIRQQQQVGQQQLAFGKQQLEAGQVDMDLRRAQQQQMERQNAQNLIDSMRPALIRNPHYASDPTVKTKLSQAYDTLGMPMPTDAQGDLDINALKIQPGDPRYAQIIDYGQALPAGQARKAYYDAQQVYYTPEMIASQAALSPKDQAAIMRAKSLGVHEANMDRAVQARLGIQRELADNTMNLTTARIQQIRSNIVSSTISAQARLTEANAAEVRAKAAMGTLQLRTQMFEQNPQLGAQRLLTQQAAQVKTEVGRLDSEISKTQAMIEKATNDGVGIDPQNPNGPGNTTIIDALNQRLDNLQQQRNSLNDSLSKADALISTNLGAAGTIRGASGARNVTVDNVGGGVGTKGAAVPGNPGYTFTGEKQGGVYVVVGPDGTRTGWQP